MTAINHALTGATIGFLIGDPLLSLPLSFLSHFGCDSLPHFDSSLPTETWLKSRNFKRLLLTDASLCVLLVVLLAITHPAHWLAASICAFLATSPDLFWINRFYRLKKRHSWKPNLFSRFAAYIQWFTGPIGAAVEGTWFICGLFLVTTFIQHNR